MQTRGCKFCHKDRVAKIGERDSPHFDLSYDLLECPDCGCRFFDIFQHEVDLDRIYQNYVPRAEFKRSPYWRFRKKDVLKFLGKDPSSVLDVGCRTGDFLLHFEESVKRDGVELSSAAAKVAENRGINVYACRLEDIEFRETYDVVSAFAILEHLIEPSIFLEKLNSLVAENGLLVILTPSHQCLKAWVIDHCTKRRWHMYSPPEHLNFYSKRYIDNYLEERGFSLVDRSWASGGMWNPFRKVPGIEFLFKATMLLIDESYLKKVPIFDHMYSIYRKVK